MDRLHAVIRGRVQGVGFRYFVRREARSLALKGWVRNLADGTVELGAEGDRAALDALLVRIGEGPPGARVSEVQTDWSTGEASYLDFRVTD